MSSVKPRADVMAPEPTGTPAEPSAYGRGVDAATLVGLLADPTRLKVVAALALGAGTLEEVAEASGLPLKDVALAARRLARAGLVRRDGKSLELHAARFGEAARAAARAVRGAPPRPRRGRPAAGAALRRPGRGRRPLRLRPGRPAGVDP